ncbi:MAG TPA: hypothetical protein VIH99_00695 [Bdellovibrionota bacterium]|jgi:hypothetical protein
MPILALLFSLSAWAAPNWEACLDKADYHFTLDTFLQSITATKSGCVVKFALSGGKGEKFEIDLCSPIIHIDHFNAIDAKDHERALAGTLGCPAPLFATSAEEDERDSREYRELRRRVFDIFDKVKKEYGPDADTVDIANPKNFSAEVSSGKIACVQFLLKEYLMNCTSFEGKKSELKDLPKEPVNKMPDIPGVHPQTIINPKK